MKNANKNSVSKFFLCLGLSAGIFFGCEKERVDVVPDENVAIEERNAKAHVPNEVLVKFKAGVSETGRANALARVNGRVAETILTGAMSRAGERDGVFLVRTPMAALNAISSLKGAAEVEYAEPNYIYNHFATSNDTYFTNGSLWGMYGAATSPANQFGSHAAVAWAAGKTGSSTVYVGVIDEGYMFTHEDLAANAGTNPGEVAGNGVDDDGNGYVDDVYGWDFAGNNNTVFDGVGDDHGTHVAGTIGGVGGNARGVAGVCWNIKLLSGKFLGSNGGTTANAIRAIDYFTDLKTRHNLNIVATNNSWGGGGFSQLLADAIERANQAGILFVAAAGNSSLNMDSSPSYPASYSNSNIISVASITSTGGLSSFSNFGLTTTDIGAPGSGIWSTIPRSSRGRIISSYASYNGTSMAAPHVAGAAALYKSLNPGASAAQVKNAIMSTATPTSSLSGKCVTGGRLNVSSF